MVELLKDITVLDFTSRLPGPFGTKILSELGAQVIKVEDKRKDPFNLSETHQVAPHFKDWYQNFNHMKELRSLDLTAQVDEVQKLIKKSDLLILPMSSFFKKYLVNFNLAAKKVIWIAGGKPPHSALHDLNAMAMTRSFSFHLKNSDLPPFLPQAGIAFGQYIATYTLAAYINKQKNEHILYMEEVVKNIFDSFYSKEMESSQRLLHNGLYPAYNIYRTLDHKSICLAAIEEHYWLRFVEIFELKLHLEDRFDKSGKVIQILKDFFANLSSDAIKEKIKSENICLTMI